MLIFDLETDGFLDELTRVHCIHLIDQDTGRRFRFNEGLYADGSAAPRDGSLLDGVQLLANAEGICGHNIIGYDIPVLQKIYPGFTPPKDIFDTLIAARVIWPNIGEIDAAAMRKGKRPEEFGKHVGSHRLESWGIRLGVLKAEYSGGWADFTPEMDSYGAQDPVATQALYERILAKGYADEALQLEFRVAYLLFLQERHGFLFDRKSAEELEYKLIRRKAELSDLLQEAFPPWVAPVMAKGQQVVLIPKRDNAKLGYTAGVPVPKFKTVSFNPGSRQHIADRMRVLFGWTPVEYTESGQPKVDETTLTGLDYPEAKLLTEYLTVEKRLGQLAEGKQAWLKKVKADGRIHGRVNPVGAITRRMTHSDPNLAQVPSCGAPYGPECRALFTVENGMKLVGCDAEGLELRVLGHYMALYDGGAYVETVIHGNQADGTDVHTVNQRLIGLNLRYSAKTWIYAYLYGAGLLKLGSIIYDDMTEAQREKFNARYEAGQARDKALASLGKRSRSRVEEGLPALGKLQEKVKSLASRGYLKTVDGGRLVVRSAHSALNTLLQGGGAVVLKKALVILDDLLQEAGWVSDPLSGWYHHSVLGRLGPVCNVHDEWQFEVEAGYSEEFGKMAADAMRLAGEAFNFRCPLSGSYGIGVNWAETH